MTPSKEKVLVVCEYCGRRVFRYVRSDSKLRFCSPKCSLPEAVEKSRLVDRKREKNPSWRGGIRMALGYRFLLKPEHPRASDKGYVQEHRLVMEESLGRYLTKKERVHHLNGIKTDNRIDNLQLLSSQGDHISIHQEELIKKRWLK
jgi:hypothetical protein